MSQLKNSISIKCTKENAIDFDSILESKHFKFWSEGFNKTSEYLENASTYLLKKAESSQDLIKAMDAWLPLENRNYICETKYKLDKYLYAGDISVMPNCPDGNLGISAIMERSFRRIRNLNTMYYYYCISCADSFSPYQTNTRESRLEFCRIVIENIRLMLAQVWDYKFLEQKLLEGNNDITIVSFLDYLFFNYELLKSPARQAKVLKVLSREDSLPEFKDIKKKYHIVSALCEEKFQELKDLNNGEGKDSISFIVNELSDYWLDNIKARNISLEEDAFRFNEKLDIEIESLRENLLRTCEKQKNIESGAKGREVKMEKGLEGAAEVSNKTLERFRKLRPLKLSMDGEENLGVQRKVEASSITESYCPDDFSAEAWDNFDGEQKLFLISNELCASLESKTGFMGLIRERIGARSSYILINIVRICLEQILQTSLDEVKASNKKEMEEEIKRQAVENNCVVEIENILSKLRSTKIAEIIAGTDTRPFSMTLRNEAYEIYEKLNNKKLSKTRN